MTTEEKRMRLTAYCGARSCSRCPLQKGFKCGDGESFLKKNADGSYAMADKTVDKAYALAIEKKKAPKTVETKNPPVFTVPEFHRKIAVAYHDCPYNSGCKCESPDSQCVKCGWNPEVDAVRREKLGNIFRLPTNIYGLHRLLLKKK